MRAELTHPRPFRVGTAAPPCAAADPSTLLLLLLLLLLQSRRLLRLLRRWMRGVGNAPGLGAEAASSEPSPPSPSSPEPPQERDVLPRAAVEEDALDNENDDWEEELAADVA